jgi:5-methylcytosine-specific restriction endonuclease McrA
VIGRADAPPVAEEAPAEYLRSLALPPAPEAQLDFLAKLQRIFDEGEFTATYKFALLVALTELAVERGRDDGGTLLLRVSWIAEKFSELYWPQTAQYSTGAFGTTPAVLAQNLGRNARVLTILQDLRTSTGLATIAAARRSGEWSTAVREIARTVHSQPLRYLQNVGGETIPFLYRFTAEPGTIELQPGVVFNLRRFQGLVHQLARAGWVRHVRENPRNSGVIGDVGDLEAFMFGLTRTSLEPAREPLAELQSRRCFYCDESLGAHGEVDHFVPWSKYPRDLAHNFVLAHAACNRSKSDMLAGLAHLEKWRDRNARQGDEIGGALGQRGFLVDPECSLVVARWAYQQAASTGAHAWTRAARRESVGPEHVAALDRRTFVAVQ